MTVTWIKKTDHESQRQGTRELVPAASAALPASNTSPSNTTPRSLNHRAAPLRSLVLVGINSRDALEKSLHTIQTMEALLNLCAPHTYPGFSERKVFPRWFLLAGKAFTGQRRHRLLSSGFGSMQLS